MRTTPTTMNQQMLYNLDQLRTNLNQANEQISSGLQMSTPSDNPVNLVVALGLRSNLAELKQYGTNLVYGSSVVNSSSQALEQMKTGLMRAKVLAENGINGSTSSADRAAMAQEVSNLFDEAVTLANTQVDGKYIFGGYRTAGYNDVEPAPFIADQAEGYRLTGNNLATLPTSLTGTVTGSAIAAGDLTINGTAVGAIAASAGATDGLFMDTAADAVTQINAAAAGVTASLTTLYAGGAATGDTSDGVDSQFSFDVNGVNVAVTIPDGSSAGTVASLTADAINGVSDQTGVKANVGDGANGGVANSVVLQNTLAGDNSAISITNYTSIAGDATTGLGNISQAADASHNTGQVSLSSSQSFSLASPNNPTDDSILQALGLGGGGIGFADQAGDGNLVYGYSMAAGDLVINGIPIGASTDDGYSSAFAASSAMAKAAAINAASDQTGVTAVITPVYRLAEGSVEAGTMDSGDLRINGVDIFDTATAISAGDSTNALLDAINSKTADTGITASRNSDGVILLTPVSSEPGINLQIETSANGEKITHLNGGSGPQNEVYFGAVQLRSDHKFTVANPDASASEPGLASIGLTGGEVSVTSVMDEVGNVRYVGDKQNDIALKIGKQSSLDISMNGQSAVMDTGIFTTLNNLKNYLNGEGFTSFHSENQATNTTVSLDSGYTGLASADDLTAGTFTVTVTDNSTDPPTDLATKISVDPSLDTLDSVAAKINGIPGLTAQWDSDGYLQVKVDDSSRYTVALTDDSSNFLNVVGARQEDIQAQALGTSMDAIDNTMEALSNNISDFGARANRISVQNQIYNNLELTTSDSLSKAQDTDLVAATMKLTSTQTAYQAALSAAARTMQLSLVNFL